MKAKIQFVPMLTLLGLGFLIFAEANDKSGIQNESNLGNLSPICGTPHFHKQAVFLAKNFVKKPLSLEELKAKGKIDELGNIVADSVGQQVEFWTYNFFYHTYERITATCRAVGANCYIYVDNNEFVSAEVVNNIVNEFDSNIYPTDRATFGNEWKPGIDGDDRVTILIYNIRDAFYYQQGFIYIAGYFNPQDEYRRNYSNEREMFYVDLDPLTPGSDKFYGVMTHEFQHLIHWNQDADEERWVDEGCSELATFICGYGIRSPRYFTNDPDNDLTSWDGNLSDYSQCFMWTLYFYEHYGGSSTIKTLVSEPANGTVGIDNALSSRGYSERFSDVFHDWIIANYLDDLSVGSGKYGYVNLDLSPYPMNISDSFNSYPVSSSGSVNIYAADYIKFTNGSSATFNYSGPGVAQLIEAGSSTTAVEDVTNGTLSVPGFGSTYSMIILVVDGSSSGGSYNYSVVLESVNYVQVSLPDTNASPGTTINIPIYVSDVTGKDIYSVGVKLAYNSSVLVATGATTVGTISSGWGSPTVNLDSGQIAIGMAGTTALSGSGTLVYVNFNVIGSAGDTTTIHFAEVIFNEGNPQATTDDGLFGVRDTFAILGNIRYYQGDSPIRQATVHLTGGVTRDVVTDDNGNYQFTNLSSADYTVTPDKRGDVGNSISHFDASYVLRYWAGLLDLNPYQKIAADVTGNGEVSHFDASYILRYYVGLIDQFPVGADWKFVPTSFPINDTNWPSAPNSLSYTPLNSTKTNQDFKGIVYGDVTGNWSSSLLAKPQVDEGLFPRVNLDDFSGLAGEEVILPITVKDISDVYSAGIVLEYDPDLLKVIRVKTTDLTKDHMVISSDTEGQLRIALAGVQAIEGSGSLVDVIFKVSEDAKVGQTSLIRLTEVDLNELGSTGFLEGAVFRVRNKVPTTYSLSQNYPNPFNAETQINYSLPKTDHVTLCVYNLMGQKIKTLVDESREAGSYQAIWDGRDERGETVSSGVYFLIMRAGEFKQIKKVLLMR